MTLRAMRSLPLCLSALSVLLTGCTLATTAAPNPLTGTTIGGKVYGGQNPVNGAKIYLLAVNPAAYGSASLSLLTAAGTGNAVDTIGAYATSDTLGNFALTGDYSCTKGYALGATTSSGGTTLPGNEQIYLYALGGDSGSGSNTSIGLLAALGPCNAQYSSSLQVNEITTVAAAYALAGFATDATHISSSGTTLALTGLTNAGLNSANLVSVATGAPVASSTGITRPVATLYTLADILAACVNSSGATASCSTLFQYTESSGATGTPATDTATAAINLAHNPYPTSAGMSALFPLVGTNPPFVGGLSNQPNDFTVGVSYTGNGLNNPFGIAIDASGNAWLSNYSGNSFSEFSTTGAAIATATSTILNKPRGVAIDNSGNVWLASSGNSTIAVYTSSASQLFYEYGGDLSGAFDVAIDASGNAWITTFGNNGIIKLSPSGGFIFNMTGGGLAAPTGVAIDASGNAWVSSSGNSGLSEFSSTGTAIFSSTGGATSAPYGIAMAPSGNAWVSSSGNNSVYQFAAGGSQVFFTNAGGLSAPYGIAIDGSGSAWVSNSSSQSVSRLSSTGAAVSPASGYIAGGSGVLYSIAIDGSGNVWTADYNNSAVIKLVGAASPVVTPLAANLITPYSAPASKP